MTHATRLSPVNSAKRCPICAAMRGGSPAIAADAEDLLQDCLLRAMVNWHRFQEGTNLRAWLFTVMRNLHINSYRRPSHHEVALPPDELAMVAPARPPAQEAAVEMTDFLRAFGRLSPARQETIMMVGWDGMSYDDAAARLGVPTGTVRSRLSRAREELRDALRGDERWNAHMTDKTASAEHDLDKLIADVQSLKRDLAALADHSRGTLWSGAADTANAIGAEAQRLYDGVAAQGKRPPRPSATRSRNSRC